MRSDTSEPEILEKITSRGSLLKVNAQLIAQLQKRINGKRFKQQEGDSVKLGYIRCLISAIGVYSQALRDVEISEVKKELDDLRELLKSQNRNQGSINGRSK
jgi:hypothetical protein